MIWSIKHCFFNVPGTPVEIYFGWRQMVGIICTGHTNAKNAMYVYTSCIHYIYTGEVLLSLSLSTCNMRPEASWSIWGAYLESWRLQLIISWHFYHIETRRLCSPQRLRPHHPIQSPTWIEFHQGNSGDDLFSHLEVLRNLKQLWKHDEPGATRGNLCFHNEFFGLSL